MYKIYIDTTDRYKNIIKLIKDDIEVEVSSGEMDIVVEIQNILDKHSLKITDVSEVIANEGPGSFTGIKIGVTVANVMNWVIQNVSPKKIYEPKYGGAPNIFKTPWTN